MIWSGFLMVPYLLCGVVSGLVLLVIALMPTRVMESIPVGPAPLIAATAASVRGTKTGLARSLASDLLKAAAEVAVWPATSAMFRGRHSRREVVDLRIRRPVELAMTTWLVVFAALTAVLVQLTGQHWYLRAACYAMVIAAMAMPLRWLVMGAGLREELRRTVHDPLVQFTVIAVADFAALIIAAFVLLGWRHETPLRWRALWLEGEQVVKLSHLSAIWQARQAGLTEILVGLASLSVYALLVSQLGTFWRFRRTDADRIEVAVRLVYAGDLEGAERWLQAAGTPARSAPDGVRAEGLLSLARDNLDDAFRHAKAMATVRRLPFGSPEDRDDARRVLAEWAERSVFDDGGAQYVRVVGYLIADGISDACLAAIAPGLLPNGGWGMNVPPGKVARWYGRLDERRRLAEAAGRGDVSVLTTAPDDGEPPFPAALTDPPYPLALAMLEVLRDELKSAAARIDSVRRPRRITERVVQRVLSSLVIVSSARDKGGIEGAREAALHDTVGLLEDASEWPMAQFPLWLREWLADEVDQRLHRKGFFGGKRTTPGLLALRRSLLETPGSDTKTGSAGAASEAAAGSAPAKTPASRRTDTRKAVRDLAQPEPAPDKRRAQAEPAPDKVRIVAGPTEIESPPSLDVYRYWVRHGEREQKVIVTISRRPAESGLDPRKRRVLRNAVATKGRSVLDDAIRAGRLPKRILVDQEGDVTELSPGRLAAAALSLPRQLLLRVFR
jgi:hypothetical protein